MKTCIEKYKVELEKFAKELSSERMSLRTAESVDVVLKCWLRTLEVQEHIHETSEFTISDAVCWAAGMKNADGTTGAHWTLEQTSSVAESVGVVFEHITDYCWWIALNMIYSDYCAVAKKHGVDTAEFYADMAKAFLFDEDGGAPQYKVSAYYNNIVKAAQE